MHRFRSGNIDGIRFSVGIPPPEGDSIEPVELKEGNFQGSEGRKGTLASKFRVPYMDGNNEVLDSFTEVVIGNQVTVLARRKIFLPRFQEQRFPEPPDSLGFEGKGSRRLEAPGRIGRADI